MSLGLITTDRVEVISFTLTYTIEIAKLVFCIFCSYSDNFVSSLELLCGQYLMSFLFSVARIFCFSEYLIRYKTKCNWPWETIACKIWVQ